MQFTSKVRVMGVNFFTGNIDGKDINSGVVFIEEGLDESTERAKGFRSVEYKTMNSELPKRLLHNAFPMMAEVTFETKVGKATSSISIINVKPVELAPQHK